MAQPLNTQEVDEQVQSGSHRALRWERGKSAPGAWPGEDRRVRRLRRSFEQPFLAERDIRDIVAGEALAVILDGFYTSEDGRAVAERLQRAHWETYEGGIKIGRVGLPLFDCFGETSCDKYFDSAMRSRSMIQQVLTPYANPADVVQKELDLAWPKGCNVFSIGGKKCFVGLPRSFADGGGALPHTDCCGWDWPCVETEEVQAQLGFNLYLTMAEEGGELELWDTRPTREQYDAMRDSYGLRRELLSEPSAVICPVPGELILFNASRIHAVRPSTGGGERVTVSGFIGYRGEDRPLVVFS